MPDDQDKTTNNGPVDESQSSDERKSGPSLGLLGPAPVVEAAAPVAEAAAPAAEAAPIALTGAAVVAAAGSIVLLGETVRAATAGEKTPIEVADEYYHTHFGDIWGWMKGDYRQPAADREKQLQQAVTDSNENFRNSTAGSSQLPCQAPAPQQTADADPRQAEYESYKSRCNESPPPGLSLCDKRRWEVQRNKDCRDSRQAWDDKWQPGRHKKDIEDLDRGIKIREEWIKKNCK